LHLCWATGTGSDPQLYYGKYNASSGALAESTRIATNAAGYYDPAKILVAPDNTIWLIYTQHDDSGNDEIMAQRRPAAATAFEAAFKIVSAAGAQNQPAAVFDRDGLLNLAYIDERAPRKIVYLKYNLATKTAAEQRTLTTADLPWQRPAIALDGRGGIYAVWEQEVSSTEGQLWFSYSPPPKNAANIWILYE
ncbi:hypothetical protein LLG95_12250, partial [bacterium]|nr:hypothetical protein [bacterium]